MHKHYDFVVRNPQKAAQRIEKLEKELATAQAFSHWVVIERDNLREAIKAKTLEQK